MVDARGDRARLDGIATPQTNLVSRALPIVRRTFSASHTVVAILGVDRRLSRLRSLTIRIAYSFSCEDLLQADQTGLLRRAGEGSTRTGTRAVSRGGVAPMFRSKRARIGAGAVVVAMMAAVTRRMRVELVVVVERAGGRGVVVEHVGGRGGVDHFERIVGERVGDADGDLLLQPEPVRGRVAEGRAGGGPEAGHQARRLRRQQRPADCSPRRSRTRSPPASTRPSGCGA